MNYLLDVILSHKANDSIYCGWVSRELYCKIIAQRIKNINKRAVPVFYRSGSFIISYSGISSTYPSMD